MAEAFTTDESGRRNRIIDAEVAESPKGRWCAFLIMLGCLSCAAVSVFVFRDAWAAGIFLAVPMATVIRDFIRGRNGDDQNS